MFNLKVLVMAKNILTRLGSAGLLAMMVKYRQYVGDATPIALERLDLTNTLLKDDGITEILPQIAFNFPNLNTFIFSACRLTENSAPAIVEFVENQFPKNRRLALELKL